MIIAKTALKLEEIQDDPYLVDKPCWIVRLNKFVKNANFNHAIMALIVINSITLAIHWPTISDDTVKGFTD